LLVEEIDIRFERISKGRRRVFTMRLAQDSVEHFKLSNI